MHGKLDILVNEETTRVEYKNNFWFLPDGAMKMRDDIYMMTVDDEVWWIIYKLIRENVNEMLRQYWKPEIDFPYWIGGIRISSGENHRYVPILPRTRISENWYNWTPVNDGYDGYTLTYCNRATAESLKDNVHELKLWENVVVMSRDEYNERERGNKLNDNTIYYITD